MSSKNKLEQIFGEIRESKWNGSASLRKENRHWLRYSQELALAILEHLDQTNMTQKALAEKMNVSPQLVNKWMKGNENFTLETISKIEAVLGIKLLNICIQNGPVSLRAVKFPPHTNC
jgi:ribosome-binding protein aMBF1 (putative translation factor)